MKGLGIPISLCLKYERKIGLKPGDKPDYVQRIKISDLMISAMAAAVRDVTLTAEDHKLIAEEVRKNELARQG